MVNTIVRLTGKNNENRSALLSQLHTALSLRFGREPDRLSNYILHNDLISTFRVNGCLVGLISHQNPSQDPIELLHELISTKCNIIVFTSVDLLGAAERLNSVALENNYRIIDSAPFWSGTFGFDYLAQIELENLIDLIELLTENENCVGNTAVMNFDGETLLHGPKAS